MTNLSNYQTLEKVDQGFTIGIAIILPVLFIILLPIIYLSACTCRCNSKVNSLTVISVILNYTLKDALTKEEEQKRDGYKWLVVRRRMVSTRTKRIFFIWLWLIMGQVCIILATLSLVETSSECDTSLDCFPFDNETNRALQEEPITDCSTFPPDGDVTIQCYEINLQFVEVLGWLGGTLTVTKYTINFCSSFFFWNRKQFSSVKKWLIFLIVFSTLLELTILALLLVAELTPILRDFSI